MRASDIVDIARDPVWSWQIVFLHGVGHSGK